MMRKHDSLPLKIPVVRPKPSEKQGPHGHSLESLSGKDGDTGQNGEVGRAFYQKGSSDKLARQGLG